MKILIIQSAPLGQYKKTLHALRGLYPDAEFTVVAPKRNTGEVIAFFPVCLYTDGTKKIHLFSLGWKTIRQLAHEEYDKLVMLYANALGNGYANVRLVALFVAAGEMEGWNRDGECIPFTLCAYWQEKKEWMRSCLYWAGDVVRDMVGKIKRLCRMQRINPKCRISKSETNSNKRNKNVPNTRLEH